MLVAVVGGGSWGTALAVLAARASRADVVHLVVRDALICAEINSRHTNTKYAGDFVIPTNVVATQDFNEAARADVVIIATPTQHTRAACIELARAISEPHSKNLNVVLASKGIEHGSFMLMSEVAVSVLHSQNVYAISGPSFAAEVLGGSPTIVTLGGSDIQVCTEIASKIGNRDFHIEITDDIIGVQVCGAVKNVIGIAFGMAVGIGCGHNYKAGLFVQALRETQALCVAMGGSSVTATLACGIGDMFLSCESVFSRNTRLGYAMARGEVYEGVMPEGYHMAKVAHAIIDKMSLHLPVCTGVYRVLFEQESCERVLESVLCST